VIREEAIKYFVKIPPLYSLFVILVYNNFNVSATRKGFTMAVGEGGSSPEKTVVG